MSGGKRAIAEQEATAAPGDFLREIFALLLIGFCLYGLLSMATLHLPAPNSIEVPRGGMINLGGTFGYYLAHAGAFLFGYAGWLLFLLALIAGMLLFMGRPVPTPVIKVLGAVVFTAVAAVWLAGPTGTEGMSQLAPYGAGGRLGAALSPQLREGFGVPGRLLLLAFGALISLLLTTEALLSALVRRSYDGLERGWGSLRRRVVERSERRALGKFTGESTSMDPDDEGYVEADEEEEEEEHGEEHLSLD